MNNEKIWLRDMPVLWRKYDEFFPARNMSKAQKYNAITRYTMYVVILLAIFQYHEYFVTLSVLVLLVVIYIGLTFDDADGAPVRDCRDSTADNPAANPLVMEDEPSVRACGNIDEGAMNNNIRKGVYEDSYDMNKRRILERAFYTLPVSNYPNDIRFIGGYLYNDGNDHCKVKKQGCEYYRDLRFKR